jgi:hypothetical protein
MMSSRIASKDSITVLTHCFGSLGYCTYIQVYGVYLMLSLGVPFY